MSDQKPKRLFLIPDYESDSDETDLYWGNVFTEDPGQGPLVEMANSFWAVPEAAYDALAKENERIAKMQQDDESEKYKYMDERNRLKAELLNTNELSSKLVEENAALKAHAEKLAEAINRAHVGCSGEVCRSCKALADYRKEFPK